MSIYSKKTSLNDLEYILSLFSLAREFMKNSGNYEQWGDNWPSKEIIIRDILDGNSFFLMEDNEVLAIYSFIIGEDKTYLNIKEGKWLSNKTYGTIHRVASSFKKKGVFILLQNYLESCFHVNFRIDTHKDNKIMIKQILRLGYSYRGLISPLQGGERLAFEKIIID